MSLTQWGTFWSPVVRGQHCVRPSTWHMPRAHPVQGGAGPVPSGGWHGGSIPEEEEESRAGRASCSHEKPLPLAGRDAFVLTQSSIKTRVSPRTLTQRDLTAEDNTTPSMQHHSSQVSPIQRKKPTASPEQQGSMEAASPHVTRGTVPIAQ